MKRTGIYHRRRSSDSLSLSFPLILLIRSLGCASHILIGVEICSSFTDACAFLTTPTKIYLQITSLFFSE